MHPKTRFIRFVLGLVALLGLSGLSFSAAATTYYVRTDGGTATQCTGTTNAPYPGSGSGKACAFNHPFWVLVPGQGSSLMKAGDTLSIGAGSYMMGYGAPNVAAGNCTSGYTEGCYIQDIPSGISSSQPTTITGDCSAPPELWGTGGIDEIFDMEGGHDIAIKCLNLTDHSNCIEDYPLSGQGVSACSSKDAWSRVGIRANGVKNLTLVDLNVHGFASTGVWAGGLSGTTTVTRVKVVGSGRSGWDGDLGGSGNSNSSGTLTFTDLTIGWTGCSEDYPVDGGYKGCFGQNEGGYGDGFSTAKTGGNYIFIRPQIYKNTQDGIDLLYADGTGNVTVDSGNFADDAGNDLKISGSGTVTNSVFVADCTWFGDNGYPAGADNCRAGGGLLGAFNGANQVQTWAYNTMVGNPSGMFVGDSTNAQSSDTYYFYNNIFIAVSSNGQQPFFTWFADGSYPEKVVYAGNLVWNTRSTSCDTTKIICKDPQLTNESLTAFNPTPLPSSPAINNANTVYTVTHDELGNPRPVGGGYDIGAIEYMGQPWLTPDSPPVPPAPKSGGSGQPASAAPVVQPDPVVSAPGNTGSGNKLPAATIDPIVLPSRRFVRDDNRPAPEDVYYRTGAPIQLAGLVHRERSARPVPAADTTMVAQAAPVRSDERAAPVNAVVATTAPAIAKPATATEATRSYLVVVLDWFRGIYRSLMQP